MPFQEVSTVSLRHEFVLLALQPDANRRKLCRRFGITPATGYKWLQRYLEGGLESLNDRSRKPLFSPSQTLPQVETTIISLRDEFPYWGARKLKARLESLGHEHLPSPSTITQILRRHGRLDPQESLKHKSWNRFEHPAPNHLWQMDFKGHFPLEKGRCHPLTILDDHSRYAVCLEACSDERRETVRSRLIKVFRRYGLPLRMTMDNGAPWGSDSDHRYTVLTAWLIRLGIGVSHSRPYHPQTQGKDERFHRTLNLEVIRGRTYEAVEACQSKFDSWRTVYNTQRPHQALGMDVPASRYQVSPRSFQESLPEIEYGPDDICRKVQDCGRIDFKGKVYRVGKAFVGQPVGLRPTGCDGVYHVYYCHQKISEINLNPVS